MRKAAPLAGSIYRRCLFHSGFFSFPPSSFTFRSPHLITAALASNSDFSKALPASPYSFSSSSFTSTPRSTSQDLRGGGGIGNPPTTLYPVTVLSDDKYYRKPLGSFPEATEDEDWGVEWEEEEETDPEIGDGGDGGGVVLGNVKWGEHALSLARDVLLSSGDGIALYAFKVSPNGYIYVRLDKLSNRYESTFLNIK